MSDDYKVYNFGESKGMEFENILIYPTKEMWNWIIDNETELSNETRSKLYVAVTRAKRSVAIVKLDDKYCELEEII